MDFKPEFVEQITERRAALRAELGTLLPRPAAIVWEVGCGHGHFLARYAAECPQKNCFGVDISSQRIGRARRKSERARLPNCHFIWAEAREFLQALPTGITLAEIWVLFPDPWPKKRHHKRRLLQPAFVHALAQRLSSGGYLHAATDWDDYAQEILATFSAEPLLENTAADFAERPAWRPQTQFETRGLNLGHGVRDIVFRRR